MTNLFKFISAGIGVAFLVLCLMYNNALNDIEDLTEELNSTRAALAVEKAGSSSLRSAIAEQNAALERYKVQTKTAEERISKLNSEIEEFNRTALEKVEMPAGGDSSEEAISWLRDTAAQLLR